MNLEAFIKEIDLPNDILLTAVDKINAFFSIEGFTIIFHYYDHFKEIHSSSNIPHAPMKIVMNIDGDVSSKFLSILNQWKKYVLCLTK